MKSHNFFNRRERNKIFTKMTNKDRADAYFMRLNGCSLQEIADRFGVGKQCIAQMLPSSGRANQHTRNPDRCIYPRIREYMKDNRMTYNRFAALCGSSPTVLYRNLTGETEITKRTIDKILEVTGLSYEEAFYSGEDFRCETTTIASSSASDPVN